MKRFLIQALVFLLTVATLLPLLVSCGITIDPSDDPSGEHTICNHQLVKMEATDPTCTKDGWSLHWKCALCNRCYSDADGKTQIAEMTTVIAALGHTVVTDPAIPPTATTEGKTEGSHCSVCNTVLVAQESIPSLQEGEFAINYVVHQSDSYLAGITIENPNSYKYHTSQGLQLQDIMVDGYVFLGWFTAPKNGERIAEIPKGTTGSKTVYAQWEKVVYKIIFDSPDVPIDPQEYTVDVGATLRNPEWYGYTFIGWSNDNGFIINRIKPGTTGNITLHANWTSNRNRATSYSTYAEPIIIEDDINGQFLFIYDIGKIDNVPLNQLEYFGNSQKIEIDREYSTSKHIEESQAKTIANIISNATTKSSGWTLSEDWNKLYEEGSESENLQIRSEERTDEEGNTVGGNYFVSNSEGGATYVSTESGGSYANSSKVTTDKSTGINASYDNTTEKYASAELSAENKLEAGASVSVPIKIAKVSGEVKNTTTVSGNLASGRKDTTSVHVDGSASSHVGTVNTQDFSAYYKSSANNSSTWNSETGYAKSYAATITESISQTVSEQLLQKSKYNLSESLGGGKTETASINGTESQTNEYSTSFTYSEGATETESKHIKFSSDRPGYYRLIMAGTVHVFAVVGYDIATGSYYTYTYSVLADERHEYLDYSKDNANFNDCENGIVSFEIPYEVNEYIAGVTCESVELKTNLEGAITGFDATNLDAFDGTVVVPQYYNTDNNDGSFSAYKTTQFTKDAFNHKENIETIILPTYITEIPDYAFEGCTNLKTVIAFGITSIGSYAFKDCTSLETFAIDNKVTHIGEHAFENVPEIKVMAANSNVAKSAIVSGAKRITVNLEAMSDSFDNVKINVSDSVDYFALISNGKSYVNLQIDASAKEAMISNIVFEGNLDTPLKFHSDTVSLNRVRVVDTLGFALILTSTDTKLKLYGDVSLTTQDENAVLAYAVSLSNANNSVTSRLIVSGDFLTCNDIANQAAHLIMQNGNVVKITDSEFNDLSHTRTVTFNANGGTLSQTTQKVTPNQKYGTLPTPIRENYTFTGWFTAATGGTQITADSIVPDENAEMNALSLYAQWTPKVFTVKLNLNGGSCTLSEFQATFGQALSALPVPTRANHVFNGWTTADGATVSATTVLPTSHDVTLIAKWTPLTFTITFNPNGGSVTTASKTATVNQAFGTLPTPTRDYHVFEGWYINDTRVTENSTSDVATNITLIARWSPNGLSEWVPISQVPAGAQIVENKWTYTRTQTTESTATTLAGWTQIGSYWVESASGSFEYSDKFATYAPGFDTSHTIYKTMAKAPYAAYETTTEKRVVTTAHAGYVYWHWMYDCGGSGVSSATDRGIYYKQGKCSTNGYGYKYFGAFKSTKNYPTTTGNWSQTKPYYTWYKVSPSDRSSYADTQGTLFWYRFDYYICSYTDYYKVFKYQKTTAGIESSTPVVAGGEISNVQQYVKYRAK